MKAPTSIRRVRPPSRPRPPPAPSPLPPPPTLPQAANASRSLVSRLSRLPAAVAAANADTEGAAGGLIVARASAAHATHGGGSGSGSGSEAALVAAAPKPTGSALNFMSGEVYLRDHLDVLLVPLTAELLAVRPVGADVGSYMSQWLSGPLMAQPGTDSKGRPLAISRPSSSKHAAVGASTNIGALFPAVKGAEGPDPEAL